MPLLRDIILYDVVGASTAFADVILVPARFEFVNKSRESVECECVRWIEPRVLRETLGPLADYFPDSADTLLTLWIRGRISAAFELSVPSDPRNPRLEILNDTFLGITRNDRGFEIAVPFVCVEGWSGPGLVFAESVTDPSLKERIASAFWGLLLHDPGRISSFLIRLYDDQDGESSWEYDGRRFLLHSIDHGWLLEDEDADGFNPYLPFEEPRTCPRCGGTGEESFLHVGDTCEPCRGTGMIQ